MRASSRSGVEGAAAGGADDRRAARRAPKSSKAARRSSGVASEERLGNCEPGVPPAPRRCGTCPGRSPPSRRRGGTSRRRCRCRGFRRSPRSPRSGWAKRSSAPVAVMISLRTVMYRSSEARSPRWRSSVWARARVYTSQSTPIRWNGSGAIRSDFMKLSAGAPPAPVTSILFIPLLPRKNRPDAVSGHNDQGAGKRRSGRFRLTGGPGASGKNLVTTWSDFPLASGRAGEMAGTGQVTMGHAHASCLCGGFATPVPRYWYLVEWYSER